MLTMILQVSTVFLLNGLNLILSDVIRIIPTGPVAIVKQKTSFELKCTSSFNVTWDLPELNFSEFFDQGNFNDTTEDGSLANNLPTRAKIMTRYDRDRGEFVSVLTVENASQFDEGYYICRTLFEPMNSNRLYIFPKSDGSNAWSVYGDLDLNPLKSLYVVRSPQLFVTSCSLKLNVPVAKMILQTKSGNGTWEKVAEERLQEWSTDNFNGLMLNISDSDEGTYREYRCLLSYIGSNLLVLGGGANFFIAVEEKMTKDNPAPVIQPPGVKFQIFQSRSTFNLTCTIGLGRNITWQLPTRRTSYSVKWGKSSHGTSAILTIKKASYLDTGYYACYPIDDGKLLVSQFIFVQDWNNLLLPPFNRSTFNNKIVFSRQAVVGCVPTLPSAEVKIYKVVDGGRTQLQNNSSDNSSDNYWTFDVFSGFKISYALWNMGGDYECEAVMHTPTQFGGGNITSDKVSSKRSFRIDVKGVELVLPQEDRPIEGTPFSMSCQWRMNNEDERAEWRWASLNNTTFEIMRNLSRGVIVTEYKKEDMMVSQMSWMDGLPLDAAGTYKCFLDGYESDSYSLNIRKAYRPKIADSSPEYIPIKQGDRVTLYCPADALPAAETTWSNGRNGIINGNSDYSVVGELGNKTLSFVAVESDVYQCVVVNTLGQDVKMFHVNVHVPLSRGHLAGIIIGVSVILILLILLGRAIYLNKKRNVLRKENRLRLLEGNPERLDPDAPLDEQAGLLPYDSKWEFPRNRLVLGKQLGVGQFGIVYQARAIGCAHDDDQTDVQTVAVKMVKSNFDSKALESLVSELKIMIHLGFHVNVVNLLGASTSEITKGELWVIEEFCPFGNLHRYLLLNRHNFVNELDDNGDISVLGIENDQQESFSLPKTQCNQDQERQSSLVLHPDEDRNSGRASNYLISLATSSRSFRESVFKLLNIKALETENDGSNTVINNDDGYLIASSSCADQELQLKPVPGDIVVTTRDLVCWAFQVARGMDYLASKKVIHGDLAARNVLLAEGNVVKIADFGLSRQIKYQDGNYLKTGEEALPVKWMAIESLTDRTFSTHSDVWSYGIFLWELFSLSKMPYAEVTGLCDLIQFLQRGERLPKPLLAPNAIGSIMESCWHNEPSSRPSFAYLQEALGNLLEQSAQHYYLKLNESFVKKNDDYVALTSYVEARST